MTAVIEPTEQPAKLLTPSGNDAPWKTNTTLLKMVLVFASGLLCGYFLSWQPRLLLSNHFQQIMSEPEASKFPALASVFNEVLTISRNSTSPSPVESTTVPATQAPVVKEVIVIKDCWAGTNPDEGGAVFPASYSVVREYEIMKRWMDIKKFPAIPKIIHQVWTGSSFASSYCKWMDSFRVDFMEKNPSWTYKLWNRELYEKKYGPMVLGKAYDRETYVEGKADILRYEVIWREGGIYMDADSIWLQKSFDHLLDLAESSGMFVVGHDAEIRSQGLDKLYMNGVFGATKCHPAMEHILRNLQLLYSDLYFEQKTKFFQRTGPFFLSTMLQQFPVTVLQRNVFSPGSWFFDTQGDSFDNVIRKRIEVMGKEFPDALTFQVGFNTHSKPGSDARNCGNWAKDVEPILWSLINNASSNSHDLTCGNMNYGNITFPRSLPPEE